MRRRLALAALFVAALTLTPQEGVAVTPVVPRQVLVFVVDRVSFEQLMKMPHVRALARQGGAALMSPRTVPGDRGPGHYLTLGTGVRAIGPDPSVAAEHRPSLQGPGRLILPDIGDYERANRNLAVPGLLGEVLSMNGIGGAVFGCVCRRHHIEEPGVLVAMDRRGRATGSPHFRVPNMERWPFMVFTLGQTTVADEAGSGRLPTNAGHSLPMALKEADRQIRAVVSRSTAPLLVMVAGVTPSRGMDARKDEVTPIVMVSAPAGNHAELVNAAGAMRTLTSDTTRRVGLVSNEDVAPTILDFLQIPVPAEMNGSRIRIVDDPPPFRLHARHLANRRTAVPLSVGMLVAVVLTGLVAVFLIARRQPGWTRLDHSSLALPLAAPALGTAALAAGSLPVLSYAWLVPFLVLSVLAAGALGLAFRRAGPLAPAAVVGGAVIVFFVIEALRGWPDTLFPILGGSALDGARFFGLPNTYIGLLAGAGLWLAAAIPAYTGFVLLFGMGLFAGFPDLGADLGGALTLLAAAGLWLGVRGRPRFGWREAGLASAVVAVGMALVLGAQVVLATTPTHGTRLVEGAGQRSLLGTVTERLSTSWHLLTAYPLTWVIVAGLPICMWLALRPPGAMRPAYQRHPEWRDAMVVLVLASMVAFVGNDTGAAAAGFGFGLAIAGILYLPLAERAAAPT